MSDAVRVLHVMASMRRAGAQTYVMNVYRHLDRERVQFDFVVHDRHEEDYDAEIRSLGGRLFYVDRYKGVNHWAYKKQWQRHFDGHPEHRIVHSHVRSTASIILRIAKDCGRKTIAHSHNTRSGTGFIGLAKRVLESQIGYSSDELLACSDSAGRWLYGKEVVRKNNYRVFKNAIDPSVFAFNKEVREEARVRIGVSNGELVVGHVGRFHPQKNHKFLLKIFKQLVKRVPGARLLMIGDGELRDEIQRQVAESGLEETVIMAGARSDVADLLQAMDVFVFPSIYEGLPVTLIEAQAAGLACVLSDRITEEVAITDLVRFVPLEDSTDTWVDSIIEAGRRQRKQNVGEIAKAGYDVRRVSGEIQEFYLGLLRRG